MEEDWDEVAIKRAEVSKQDVPAEWADYRASMFDLVVVLVVRARIGQLDNQMYLPAVILKAVAWRLVPSVLCLY